MVGDLHFAFLRAQDSLCYLRNSVPLGQLPMQEVAGARLLHDVRPGKPCHLTEGVIAVDDGTVLDACIGYDKSLVCRNRQKRVIGIKKVCTGS